MLLCALLLTLTSPGAGARTWDDPTCTEGVVSVARGAPAEMTCNISNALLKVSVSLWAPGGAAWRPVFPQATPGCSSRDGWRLCVEGGSARMATAEARHSQAGWYQWTLVGSQKEQRRTYLNVSEPPEQPSSLPPRGTRDSSPAQDQPWAQDLHSARDPPPGRLRVALILTPVLLLCILALGALQCRRGNCGPPGHVQFA